MRNCYNEISSLCHESREPIFITKNGHGDLAVMSIETYEMLNGKLDLYRLLEEGKTAIKADRKRPLEDVIQDIRREIAYGRDNASLKQYPSLRIELIEYPLSDNFFRKLEM